MSRKACMMRSLWKPIGFIALGVWTVLYGSPRGRYSRYGLDLATVKFFGWLFIAVGVYLLLFALLRRREQGQTAGNVPREAGRDEGNIDRSRAAGPLTPRQDDVVATPGDAGLRENGGDGGRSADIHTRMWRVPVTGPMVVFFGSLILGGPFGVAWALDDGSGNQPFPKGLRQLVACAAALHIGAVGYRLLKGVWAWEPLGPILGRLVGGYTVLGATCWAGMLMHDAGVGGLAHFVLIFPACWGFYILALAMTAGTMDGGEQRGV